MAFVIWSRRNVSHQRVRFVEARTVRTIVIVAVIAMILAALALGIAWHGKGNTHAAEEKWSGAPMKSMNSARSAQPSRISNRVWSNSWSK